MALLLRHRHPRPRPSCWPPIRTVDEIVEFLGVDSLAYLTLEHLVEAIDAPGAGFCDACLTGDYPVPVPVRSAERAGRRAAATVAGVPRRRPGRPARAPDGPSAERPTGRPPTPPPASTSTPGSGPSSGSSRWWPRRPRPEVLGGIGGFGGLFALDTGRYRAAGPGGRRPTGWAPRLVVAQAAGRFDTIGIDLVAMCVDDLVCLGAEPLFLLDYISSGAVDPAQMAELVAGVAEGCRQAGCALLGGEMAEHPGVDGARRVRPGRLRRRAWSSATECSGPTGSRAGDVLVGLASPGLRSNGYTLARHVLLERAGLALDDPAWAGADRDAWPTSCCARRCIYTPAVLAAVGAAPTVHAVAHITGGRLRGQRPPGPARGLPTPWSTGAWEMPPDLRRDPARSGGVDDDEMARVFNLGLGMVLVVAPEAGRRRARRPGRGRGRRRGGRSSRSATGWRPGRVWADDATGARCDPADPVRGAAGPPAGALGQARRLRPQVGPTQLAGSSTPSRRSAGPRPWCWWPTASCRWCPTTPPPSAG